MAEERNLTANFTANASGFAAGADAVRQKLIELNTALEQNRQKIKEANAEIKKNQRELTQLRTATNNGSTATQEQSHRMATLEDNIAQATVRLGSLRTAEQTLRSQVNTTNRELLEQRQNVQSVGAAVTSTADILKANLQSAFLVNAFARITQGLKRICTYCYEVGTAFEAAMSQVAATMGMTADDINSGCEDFLKLRQAAKECGETTKFSATEAAQALNYLALAGYDAEKSVEMLPKVLNLAAAGGMDLATASDMVTDAMSALTLQTEYADTFIDQMAKTSQKSNTNVAQLGEAILTVGGTAKVLAGGTNELNTELGILADNGIKGSEAGTALRQVILNLTTPTDEAKQKMKDLGVSTFTASGDIRNLRDVFRDLQTAVADMSDEQRTDVMSTIFDARQLKSAEALIANCGDRFDELSGYIAEADGAAGNMAVTMEENLKGKVTLMNSALESLGVAVYDKLGGGLKDAVDIFTEAFSEMSASVDGGELEASFDHLSDSFREAASEIAAFIKESLPNIVDGIANVISFIVDFRDEIFAGVAALVAFKSAIAIGNVITATVTAIKAFKTATDAATASQAVFNTVGAANPYVAIAGILSSVVAGVIAYSSVTGTAADSTQELADKTKNLARETSEMVAEQNELDRIAKEYEDITENVVDVTEKKEKLSTLQETLNGLYGDEETGIDLVNGKYQEQLGLLKQLTETEKAYRINEVTAALNDTKNDIASIEKGWGTVEFRFNSEKGKKALEGSINQAYQEIDALFNAANPEEKYNIDFGENSQGSFHIMVKGTIDEQIAAYEGLQKAMLESGQANGEFADTYQLVTDKLTNLTGLRDNNEQLEQNLDVLNGTMSQYDNWVASQSGRHLLGTYEYAVEQQKKGQKSTAPINLLTSEEKQELYNSEKELLKYRMDMGEINEAEYYNMLAQLRDKYLDENTKAWREANVEIHNYLTKANATLADVVADDTTKVKDALSEMEQAYKDTLDAIDEEIRAHNRENEDEELQKKIDAVTVRLQYAKLDEFSKYELEKELKDLENERGELEFTRSMEDKKATAEEVYTMAKEASDVVSQNTVAALHAATNIINALGGAGNNVSSNVVNNTYSDVKFVMNTIDKTIGQIVDGVTKAFTNGI